MSDDAAGLFFFFMLIGGLVVALVLCWLVGRFAENRGSSFWFGFLISFFLSPLIGFIIVFIVTSDYRGDTLVGARLSREEYLRVEQLRLQLRRTELRGEMFSNLLYVGLFAGAAYFFYQHPEPLIRVRDALFPSHTTPRASTSSSSPRVPAASDTADTVSLTLTSTPPPKQYRYYLAQPARIQTKFGVVTVPARTEISVLQDTPTSITARAMGYDVQLLPSQVTRVAY